MSFLDLKHWKCSSIGKLDFRFLFRPASVPESSSVLTLLLNWKCFSRKCALSGSLTNTPILVWTPDRLNKHPSEFPWKASLQEPSVHSLLLLCLLEETTGRIPATNLTFPATQEINEAIPGKIKQFQVAWTAWVSDVDVWFYILLWQQKTLTWIW